jgi:hypothetical protein
MATDEEMYDIKKRLIAAVSPQTDDLTTVLEAHVQLLAWYLSLIPCQECRKDAWKHLEKMFPYVLKAAANIHAGMLKNGAVAGEHLH